MYATDDRYSDDCHYTQGGNMRMYYDVGYYGGFMVALNALPPSLEETGVRWAEIWKEPWHAVNRLFSSGSGIRLTAIIGGAPRCVHTTSGSNARCF